VQGVEEGSPVLYVLDDFASDYDIKFGQFQGLECSGVTTVNYVTSISLFRCPSDTTHVDVEADDVRGDLSKMGVQPGIALVLDVPTASICEADMRYSLAADQLLYEAEPVDDLGLGQAMREGLFESAARVTFQMWVRIHIFSYPSAEEERHGDLLLEISITGIR